MTTPLEPAAEVEIEADERGETPSGQPLHRRPDDAAAERGSRNQGQRAM